MAKDDKVRMPSSMAGITQYFDEETSRFHITPKQVMIIIGFVMVMIIALHLFNPLA